MKKPNYPTVTATVIDEDTMRYGGSAFKREQTCKNLITEEEQGFICSKCSAYLWSSSIEKSHVDDEGIRWYGTPNDHRLNFCPNCGARVERGE